MRGEGCLLRAEDFTPLEDLAAQDRGEAEKKGKPHRRLGLEAEHEARGDGRARSRDAWGDGHALREADRERIEPSDALDRPGQGLTPEGACEEEQAPRDEEADTHDDHAVEGSLEKRPAGKVNDCSGDRRKDDEPGEAAMRIFGVAAATQRLQHRKHELADVAAEVDPESNEGAHVERHFLEGAASPEMEKLFGDDEVSRTRDRQELREALNDAQNDRLQVLDGLILGRF